MDGIRVILALAISWLVVCVWIARIIPRGLSGRSFLIAGYSLIAGLIVIPLIMRGLSFLAIPFSLTAIGFTASFLFFAGFLVPQRFAYERPGQITTPPVGIPDGRWAMLFVWLCVALIALRFVTLGVEVGLRPIFAWDGKQHWAKQAKIFFEMSSIANYVPFSEWLDLGGKNVYTTVHPDYPITIPLLQTWMNTAIGRWDDTLMNLPWLLCYIALGLVFFGQLRAAGASTTVAACTTYMLLSVPYLNVQVALAGYADIFLATCYLAAIAAFHNWANSRSLGQGVLAVFFAISCPLIKLEGFFWLFSFTPGLLVVMLGLKRATAAMTGVFVLVVLLLWSVPNDWSVAFQSIRKPELGYKPESWLPMYKSFLVHDNWHLLGYVCIAMILGMITLPLSSLSRLAPLAAIIATGFCAFLVLYLATRHSFGAVHLTSINRVALQLIPAIAFFATCVYLELCRERFSSAGTTTAAT